MLLKTFFLRYRADTGQAVKDIKELDKTEQTRAKRKKTDEQLEEKAHVKKRRRSKETVEDTKKTAKAAEELKSVGKDTFDGLISGGGRFASILGRMGPAGIAAAVGVTAVAGAVAIALRGVEQARLAAQDAVQLGEQAYAARLSQGELIRLQNQGRVRGLADEQINQSAQGVYGRASEIRAAQRQAAIDPASGFNNPLIKMGNLMKKAGVDISASLEVQMEQQDKYLRSLVANGEQQRALVEGVELFGRSLADVKSVISTTEEQVRLGALAMAEESQMRRKLQKDSEDLATAEGILANERKKTEEQTSSKLVPATKEFTEAMTEWERAIRPLKETWAELVASLISGLADLINAVNFWKDKTDDELAKEAGQEAYNAAIISERGGPRGVITPAGRARAEQARKDAEAKVLAELAAGRTKAMEEQKARAPGLVEGAVNLSGIAANTAEIEALREAIESDPNIDTQEEALTVLKEIRDKSKEQGQVQKAQTDLTKKIESNTAAIINTGLEQAMALWAGSAGKAGGVGGGAFTGETRESYEQRIQALRRINPNLPRQISEARATLGGMGSQASAVNKAGIGSAAQGKGGVTTGPVTIHVESKGEDGQAFGRDVAKGFQDELASLVFEFSTPLVS